MQRARPRRAADPRRLDRSRRSRHVRKGEVRVQKKAPTLESIVGAATYGVWVKMLKVLVPGGRTHRLAPLVAGMLQYAAGRADRASRGARKEGSVADVLLRVSEHDEDGAPGADLVVLVERLFRDAGAKSRRVDRRGERYSLVDAAIQEFI